MTDLRQSSYYAKYLESIGWRIEQIDNTFVYLKKIPFFGWFAKIQRPIKIISKACLFEIEKKYRPFQISIEPLNKNQIKILVKNNFKISNQPSLPTKTLIVDLSRSDKLRLSKSEKELLKSFSQKTRYNIKLSQKKDIKIIESKNILDFTNFWRQNFEKKRFPIFSQQRNIIAMQKAFGKNSQVLLAKKKDDTIAALFLLFYDKVAYYMYAASNDEGRKNFAPTLLTWNAILLVKKMGCKTFDFDGIYDERFPLESWQGFTKFKKGFKGKEVEYPGKFVKSNSWFKI